MKFKVAIAGPDGPITNDAAFKLLYAFETREAAEEYLKCFSAAGKMVIVECDDTGNVLSDKK